MFQLALFFFSCVYGGYACVSASSCGVYMCVHIVCIVESQGLSQESSAVSLLYYFWGEALQSIPEHINKASHTGQLAVGIPCPCLPDLELQASHHPHSIYVEVWGSTLRSFCLQYRCFSHWALSPAPGLLYCLLCQFIVTGFLFLFFFSVFLVSCLESFPPKAKAFLLISKCKEMFIAQHPNKSQQDGLVGKGDCCQA